MSTEHKYILDKDGNPVVEHDAIKWANWFENAPNRRIAYEMTGEYHVSTVFLGLDHNFSGSEPILWETMAFENKWRKSKINGKEFKYQKSIDQDRYHTRAEALAGHEAMVLKLRKKYYHGV